MGRRVKKAVYAYGSGTWELQKEILFVYDGWNLIQEKEVSATGDPLFDKFYVWGLDLSQTIQGAGGIGGLVCRVSGGEVRHYFYDVNGNVGQMVNPADGSVSARYEYDPFGNAVFVDGADAAGNVFRFSTKYWDEETDLVYYGFRYYSLGLERWTARDPFQERGGLNLLVFARNNPLTFVDPLGNDYSSYTGSSPEDVDFGGGSWQSPRKPYMMDPPSPVLPYINAGTQLVAGAVLMVLPDGTITKAGGILLITDGVDKLQALIRGDRTEFEKYLDRFGLSEGEKQAILCLKEFSIITIEVSVVFTKGPAPKNNIHWNNGWRTADGKFAKPQGPGRAGQAAVDKVAEGINAKEGWRIVGSEVSVRDASGQLRRYDFVAESPSGNLIGVEVKSGTSSLTSQQRAFDRALNSSGMETLAPVGQNAGVSELQQGIRRALMVRVP